LLIDGNHIRTGYFLIVGDFFGFTLSRPQHTDNRDIHLSQAFQSDYLPDTAMLDYLRQYICRIGRWSDWMISYSVDYDMIGLSFLPTQCSNVELVAMIKTLRWEVVSGENLFINCD
jgi:hypothetical protein